MSFYAVKSAVSLVGAGAAVAASAVQAAYRGDTQSEQDVEATDSATQQAPK